MEIIGLILIIAVLCIVFGGDGPPYEIYAQTDYAKVKPVFEKLKSARAAIAELEKGKWQTKPTRDSIQ